MWTGNLSNTHEDEGMMNPGSGLMYYNYVYLNLVIV